MLESSITIFRLRNMVVEQHSRLTFLKALMLRFGSVSGVKAASHPVALSKVTSFPLESSK